MEKDQYQPLFEKLSIQPRAILLTPNQRLSKHLQQKFQKFRLEQYKKDKSKPLSIIDAQIMSMGNYLKLCFSEIQDQHPLPYGEHLLLEGSQEKLIWQKIIELSQYGQSILFKQQCAQEAAQAWQLIHDWQLNTSNFEQQHYYESIDILAFKNWEKQFRQQCKQQKWLSQAELLPFILKAFETRELQSPSHLYFYGFDELNILLKKFQHGLEVIGVNIKNIPLPKHQANYHSILACTDFKEEIHYAAIWARQITSQNPSANVALIFPNLSQNRDIILRHCIENLCPDKLISGAGLYPLPFNISSGISLAKIPLVAAALSLLAVNQIFTGTQTLPFEKLSRMLLCQFIPEALWPITERIRIESTLRDLQQEEISLVQFKRALKDFNHNQSIIIFFNEAEIYIKKNSGKLSHTLWNEYFLKQLSAFQWLADFNLDSENFQALNKLKNCLGEFSQLDNIEPQCSLEKALERVNFIINQQLFQPESKDEHSKQIHILGALEAAALDFTHIWVCQMDDETWPPRPKPNPFLPFSLQKTLALPHSSAQREYNFCKHLTERYMAHCNSIIFSYSNSEKDKVSSSSPLLTGITKQTIFDISNQFQIDPDLFITNNLLAKINTSSQWEYFSDHELIPVEKDEKIRGGQTILQNHANCPFRSFAQHRLNLEPLAEIEEGINSLERGALLHELMEKIWKSIASSENLQKISQSDLKTLVATLAKHLNEENIQKFPQKHIALKLEIERAQAIALNILEIDKQRPAFTIFSLEKAQAINIAGLKTNIRIDRIDELEDGSLLFIDYKSGQQHQNKWLTPRMEEPQLPLYLISNDSDKKASGVAFAKLNHNDPGYIGIGNRDNIAPGIVHCAKETKNNRFERDWEKQISLWQEDLSMLAKDFLAGNLLVDPKNKSKTCEYCNFQKLCRIQEVSN